MSFFIYENWQAGPRKAVVHTAACGHCNFGAGKMGGFDPSHAQWHGPFTTLEEARRTQTGMNVVVRKECSCIKGLTV